MCGIAGILSSKGINFLTAKLPLMTNSISHRGPDGFGYWYSENKLLALGHRRLSIIDLSENGSQPMHYLNRYTITFNGEIYNYIELREILIFKGYKFKSNSDTEVILAAYDFYGIDCLQQFDGMFAFALYDKQSNKLFCARDRFGEKPFYYSFYNDDLYFASEMKALWAVDIEKTKNETLLFNYLYHDLVENPLNQEETFFSEIHKLKPGHYFIVDEQKKIVQKKYWELNINTKNDFNPQKASQIFKELFYNSVKKRLRSDVPVGSSLSGGLDSSSVVAAISQYTTNNYTFSARFPGFSKDEGVFINEVVSKFKTKHHNIEINEKGILEDLEKLIEHQEEPFQTGSIYAQWCVYREARKNGILVMLDGQGADEFLCGYDKDFKFYLKEIYNNKILCQQFKRNLFTNQNYKVSLSYKDLSTMFFPDTFKFITQLKKRLLPPFNPGINSEFFNAHKAKKSPFKEFNTLKEMLKYEMTNQGLEKLLKFADRNSMAHSVEVRLPFLNHELVEFVLGLKSELILKNGWSKAILRDAMENELPNNIIRRKDKIGFEAPHNQWENSNKFQHLIKDSKSYLIKNKIITEEYSSDWKTVITAKFLQNSKI